MLCVFIKGPHVIQVVLFSYFSFTWTASRLDRSIITVLTGQAVDLFDQLFQDLYTMSNAVDMNKLNLEKEKKLEPISKVAPPLQPSTTMALKLINPKYALVSDAASNNHMVSEMFTAKSNSIKQMKEVSEGPYIHPGLLHLEKANMIDYLPVWPEPDPPSDVIGFINTRNCNKPLRAHLTRSELFEVTQAIRFKDPIHIPQESEKVCPIPTSQNSSSANEQMILQPQNKLEEKNEHCNYPQQIFPPHSLKDQVVCLPPILDPNPAHSSKKDEVNSPVDENQTNVLSKQREKVDAENICTSFEPCKDFQISENPLIENITPSDSDECNAETTHTPVVQTETTSDKQSCENITETLSNKDFQANQWNIHNLIEPDTHKTDHVDSTGHNGNSIYSDSRSSFSSEEYFECRESVIVDSESVGMVKGTPAVSRYPDEPNNATESLSGSCKNASSHEAIKETEESKLQCASPEECHVQHLTGVTADLELTSVIGVKGLSETVSIANEHQDSTSQQGTECELLHQMKTDTHTAHHMFDGQPAERNNSPESSLLVNKSFLQDHVAVPYVPVQKTAEAQCIVFSDTVNKVPLLRLNPEIYSGFNYTSNLKYAPVDTDLTLLSKPASFNTGLQKENNPNTESGHKELSYQNKPLMAEESTNEQATEVRDVDNFNSEPKESAAAQTVDKQLNPKILTGFKVVQLSVDIYPLKRKTLEHLCVQQES